MPRVLGALALVALLAVPALAQPDVPSGGTLPEPLVAPAVAAVDDAVYLLGGRTSGGGTAAIVRYDVVTGEAAQVGTLPSSPAASPNGARESAVAFALGGEVFVAGGAARVGTSGLASDIRALSDIIAFDPATNATRVTADALPSPRFGAAVATLGQRAYIVGGYGTSHLDEVVVYDAAAPEGSRVSLHTARFPTGVRDARAVALDDALLVVGGQVQSGAGPWTCAGGSVVCASANVARFDPVTGATSVVARLWAPMTVPEVGRIGDAVFVIGGLGSGVGTVINASRIDTSTWGVTNGTRIENATGAGAVAAVDGTLYRFGGRLATSSVPRADIRIFYGDVVPPGRPLALAARPEGDATRVSWLPPMPPVGAVTYRVERVDDTGAAEVVSEGAQTSALDVVPAGEVVTYRVVALNGTREGPAALVRTVAGTQPLPAPAEARAYSSGGAARVEWQGVAGATGYAVERDGLRVATLAADATSFTDDEAGVAYVVRALAGEVDGEPSAPIAPAPLEAPTGLEPQLVPNEERSAFVLRLRWDAEPDEEHEVLSGVASHVLGDPRRVVGNQTEPTRVIAGTTTWFGVRRAHGDLVGPTSAPVLVRAPPLPPAPGWLAANGTATRVALSWERVAPEGATYTLWRIGADGEERAIATGLTEAMHADLTAQADVLYTYYVTTEAELRSPRSPEARASLAPELTQEDDIAPPSPPTAAPTVAPTAPASPSPAPPPASSPETATPTPSPAPTPAQTPAAHWLALVAVAALLARAKRRA